MTQEEKQILLKDLCGRLPYGVICTDLRHGDSKITEVDTKGGLVYCYDFDEYAEIENCRLYLRPMDSMTEEEEIYYNTVYFTLNFYEKEDWLLEHHFDFRGLIPMGLALETPEDMYD